MMNEFLCGGWFDMQPLMRIFGPIIDNPESLLSGEHTRTIAVSGMHIRAHMRTHSTAHTQLDL